MPGAARFAVIHIVAFACCLAFSMENASAEQLTLEEGDVQRHCVAGRYGQDPVEEGPECRLEAGAYVGSHSGSGGFVAGFTALGRTSGATASASLSARFTERDGASTFFVQLSIDESSGRYVHVEVSLRDGDRVLVSDVYHGVGSHTVVLQDPAPVSGREVQIHIQAVARYFGWYPTVGVGLEGACWPWYVGSFVCTPGVSVGEFTVPVGVPHETPPSARIAGSVRRIVVV